MTKPSPLRTESFEKSTCSFFDDLQTMVISLSCLILLSHLFRTKSSPIIEITDESKLDGLIEIPFEGLTIKEAWSFKAYKPFKGIVDNNPVERIEFNIYVPFSMLIKGTEGYHYVDQPNLFQQKVIGSAFVTFFESRKDKIETKYSKDLSKWPSVLNFARVIRNAYSHKGQIHFLNPAAASVSWRTLTYSPSDNGKSIHTEIFVPEIIALMKEVEQQII
jgi:hypothetical protein